jgi:hypothetical protein
MWIATHRTCPKKPERTKPGGQPLQVRAFANLRFVAQNRRDTLWQNGAHLVPPYPRPVFGGVAGSTSQRYRSDRSDDAPVVHGWKEFDALFTSIDTFAETTHWISSLENLRAIATVE